uniref:Prolyl 4-hydroxylase alpha subunit domain-containing protein n=1 Tax=Panagrolaimus superbus TaxID=310955 RepID=A0A914YCY8_9BILA
MNICFCKNLNFRELEEQKVVDGDGSTVSKSRRAKGFWISKDDKNVVKIYQKLQNALTLDPKTSENFLITDSDNWWFVNYGDRLATALIIVKTADEGGATVFPKMKVVVSPEPGDVILWFNANLKFEQEDLSFHGACPILSGRKIAMSLWIRCKHHKDLGCQKTDAESLSHQLKNIIRNLGY